MRKPLGVRVGFPREGEQGGECSVLVRHPVGQCDAPTEQEGKRASERASELSVDVPFLT